MATVGVIGAGQLGRMLGLAGRRLGVDFVFLDPSDSPPAAAAGPVIRQSFDSAEGLRELAARADVVTYEFENVPVAAVGAHLADCHVYPPPGALQKAQDRLVEKRLFRELDIPVAEFFAVDSEAGLRRAAERLGLPLVLKTRRFGYDGKGQYVVRQANEFADALESLGGRELIAEQWIEFDREVSAIGVRDASGRCLFYPLTENVHRGGILRTSRAPAVGDGLESHAATYVRLLLDHLDYVGILALELFVIDGRLLANEFAPRVHNSGHWTIEGTTCSQFENHVRAILGRPLGNTAATGHAAMINLIGTLPDELPALEAAGWTVHDYGKSPRPGRKLGHVTIVCNDADTRDAKLSFALQQIEDR